MFGKRKAVAAQATAPAWKNPADAGSHAAEATPQLVAELDDRYDDSVTGSGFPAPVQRVYRPGARRIGFTNMLGESMAAQHLDAGDPNVVANDIVTGTPAGHDATPLLPEQRVNQRNDATPADAGVAELPPRAGSTTADNTRPSQRQTAYLIRDFGHYSQDTPDEFVRVFQPAPFAARPRQFAEAVANAFPSPGGTGATVNTGPGALVGSQPNTVRLMPNRWDENYVVGQPGAVDTAQVAATSQARAGWRGRGA